MKKMRIALASMLVAAGITATAGAAKLHKLCGPPEGRGTVSGHESGLPA